MDEMGCREVKRQLSQSNVCGLKADETQRRTVSSDSQMLSYFFRIKRLFQNVCVYMQRFCGGL